MEHSKSYRRHRDQIISEWEEFTQGERSLGAQWSARNARRAFLAHLRSKNSATTVRQKVKVLRGYYRREGKESTWVDAETPKAPKRLPEILSEKEVSRLIDQASGVREKAILEVLYSTGCRSSELTGMKMGNLDLERGTIRVSTGRRERLVMLHGTAQARLSEWLEIRSSDSDALWPDLNSKALGRLCAAEGKRTLDRPVSPRILRNSLAVHLIDQGMNVRYVQEIMGHITIESTARIARASIGRLKRTVSRHPLGGNLI